MPKVLFSEFRPDLSDLDTNVSDNVLNVVARADGYGPHASLAILTQALPGTCRGYIKATNADGSVTIFAGTSTNLYKLDNTTLSWGLVSKGGGYSTLPTADMWRFVQFNNFVLAANINTVPQSFDLTSSTLFADLAGSPPQARHIAIVQRFVVLSGISGSPYRVQWSGLNAITTWDNVSLGSNYQDLADGGLAHEVAGGEFSLIFQDTCIRRMIYAPGAPYTFQIERMAEQDGLFAPYGVVRAGDEVHYISPQGFKKVASGGYPVPIGKEKVDRTFFADVDTANLQLVQGASDPLGVRVYWAYKSLAGSSGLWDTVFVYDRVLDKWSKLQTSGEYLSNASRPGVTLEGLDAVLAASATSVAISSVNSANPAVFTLMANGLNTGQSIRITSNTVSVPTGLTTTSQTYFIRPLTADTFNVSNAVGTSVFVATTQSSGGSTIGYKLISIDALTFSLDTISTTALLQLSAVDATHSLGFFSGSNLEAKLDTPEQDGDGQRMFVSGIRVMTDAPTVYGSLFVRDNPQTAVVQTSETLVNAVGICPQRVETRYARARMRIPAGTTWSYAMGVEPKGGPAGER